MEASFLSVLPGDHADLFSLAATRRLVEALPVSLPAPEVDVGADGSVCLTWGAARFYSVSVRSTGALDCAWADGRSGHGASEPDWWCALPGVVAGAREALA